MSARGRLSLDLSDFMERLDLMERLVCEELMSLGEWSVDGQMNVHHAQRNIDALVYVGAGCGHTSNKLTLTASQHCRLSLHGMLLSTAGS